VHVFVYYTKGVVDILVELVFRIYICVCGSQKRVRVVIV